MAMQEINSREAVKARMLAQGWEHALVASEPAWWTPGRWWTNPPARLFVHSEWTKLGYYLVRYRFGFSG